MFLISSLKQSWTSVVPSRGARRAVEVAAVVIVSGLAMVLWPVERVTWENFDRIGIGMTRSEVRKILVRWPDEQFVAECRILGPNSFTWARTRGRRDDPTGLSRKYHFEAWDAPGLAIVVVFDDDRVACRCTGTSQGREDWLTRLFPSYRGWIARLF
jgi:hypothetical protein